MIVDITNELFTRLKTELTNVTVLPSYQPTTPNFPTVIFEESDNSAHISSKDSSGFTHSNVSYSVEIYTIGTKKMTDAKKIRNDIDAILSDDYGLARGTPAVLPNYLDESIYRYKIIYTGVISENKTIYGR